MLDKPYVVQTTAQAAAVIRLTIPREEIGIAMIVADNVAGAPAPGMAGVDPSITIPRSASRSPTETS